MIYLITGKLGSGKSLVAVGRMLTYMRQGRKVATNIDLRLPLSIKRGLYIRLPDKPQAHDIENCGRGGYKRDESDNGLLVFDEGGTFANSREYQDKTRLPLIKQLLHARKDGWDVLVLVQDYDLLDSQIRAALCEHLVICRRLDRLEVPLIGPIVKLIFGERLPLPRIHSAIVLYGDSTRSPIVDRWIYRGTDFYDMYDTQQRYLDDYPHGVHSPLPVGYFPRPCKPYTFGMYMRLTKIHLRQYSLVFLITAFFAFGYFAHYLQKQIFSPPVVSMFSTYTFSREGLIPLNYIPASSKFDLPISNCNDTIINQSNLDETGIPSESWHKVSYVQVYKKTGVDVLYQFKNGISRLSSLNSNDYKWDSENLYIRDTTGS